jgi:folate-dependent phosphoribosylglycinamide formyltransferase PurN
MRVLIITQNEPFYIPKMIRHILSNQNNDFEVVGYTVLKPHRKNKSMKDWFLERAKIYSLIELFYVLSCAAYVKFCSILKLPYYSNKKIFSKYGVKPFDTNDINSEDYLKKIKENNIDIIISISCPQLFKEGILKAPKVVCLNAHGTLLPRHRGVFGTWWTLNNEDKEAGGTIHTMEIKLDAGEIVWQRAFPVTLSDTQFSLAYKTKRDMAYGLVEIIKKYKAGTVKNLPVIFESSYHRAPTKEMGIEFHKRAKRVITLKDIPDMLSIRFKN